jgi:hypothetical protein
MDKYQIEVTARTYFKLQELAKLSGGEMGTVVDELFRFLDEY